MNNRVTEFNCLTTALTAGWPSVNMTSGKTYPNGSKMYVWDSATKLFVKVCKMVAGVWTLDTLTDIPGAEFSCSTTDLTAGVPPLATSGGYVYPSGSKMVVRDATTKVITAVFRKAIGAWYTDPVYALKNASVQIQNDAWLDWTPTIVWTTANPTTPTVIAKYKVIGKTVFFKVRVSSTNGNGATGVKMSLPAGLLPKTNNMTPIAQSVTTIDTTQTGTIAYVRDDGTNNDLNVVNMGTATATKAFVQNLNGCYEIV